MSLLRRCRAAATTTKAFFPPLPFVLPRCILPVGTGRAGGPGGPARWTGLLSSPMPPQQAAWAFPGGRASPAGAAAPPPAAGRRRRRQDGWRRPAPPSRRFPRVEAGWQGPGMPDATGNRAAAHGAARRRPGRTASAAASTGWEHGFGLGPAAGEGGVGRMVQTWIVSAAACSLLCRSRLSLSSRACRRTSSLLSWALRPLRSTLGLERNSPVNMCSRSLRIRTAG